MIKTLFKQKVRWSILTEELKDFSIQNGCENCFFKSILAPGGFDYWIMLDELYGAILYFVCDAPEMFCEGNLS